jgi:hypothetical protein
MRQHGETQRPQSRRWQAHRSRPKSRPASATTARIDRCVRPRASRAWMPRWPARCRNENRKRLIEVRSFSRQHRRSVRCSDDTVGRTRTRHGLVGPRFCPRPARRPRRRACSAQAPDVRAPGGCPELECARRRASRRAARHQAHRPRAVTHPGGFDARELFTALAHRDVEYVTIGGIAIQAHGGQRLTQDLDITISPTAENTARLTDALLDLDARILGPDGQRCSPCRARPCSPRATSGTRSRSTGRSTSSRYRRWRSNLDTQRL